MTRKCLLQKCFSYQNKKRKTSDFQWTVDFLLQKLLCNIYLKKNHLKERRKEEAKLPKLVVIAPNFFGAITTQKRRLYP